MKYDFSGYASKNDIKCADGRIIRKGAFKDNNGQVVPLVWQHMHNDPANILGHALLENREDGVYAYCKLNETDSGKRAKQLVEHGDITSLSIFANKLIQKGEDVLHGAIREVSLVITGANPGARIENLVIQHSDDYEIDETEAVIHNLFSVNLEHADGEEKTIKDVFDSFSEEQKTVVYALIAHALDTDLEDAEEDDVKHNDEEGGTENVKKNVFEGSEEKSKNVLSHSQMVEIFEDAQRTGSLKESFLAHIATYGIDPIEDLFPEARTITPTPELIKRDTEWVAGVISGTRHSPFSRIKSTAANITADEARALGYVKGALKKEEIVRVLKRTTTPTTIYKKQKLDRDDIIDITDFDVVAWLKAEMRIMLDEEIARAVLIGDGRPVDGDDDKINEECIRPIYTDDDLYSHHVKLTSEKTVEDLIDEILRARKEYKGSGNPAMYIDTDTLTDMLLLKDITGRRIFRTVSELAAELRVSKIVEVPVMEDQTRVDDEDDTLQLKAIIVNLSDYVIGADKGGSINMFDDFDIDYNQYKYLMETRISGALIRPKSALVIEQIVEEA